MLSEHKDTILENFLSSAIRTLNTDEIYNILIDSLILLLNPQGYPPPVDRRAGPAGFPVV